MFHFVAQNLAPRRLSKNRKILIQNICLGITWKKQQRKLKRLTICLKSQQIAILIAIIITQNLNFRPIDHKIRIFCTMATKLHQAIRKKEGSTTRTAVQITRPRTSMYQRQGNRNFTGNRFPWNYVYSWEPETLLPSMERNNFWSSYFEYYKWKFADKLQKSYSM